MARINGVDIPNNKKITIALNYIYGIGKTTAQKIVKDAKIEATKKAGELSNSEIALIREQIAKYVTEGDLRREVNMNIKNKMEIGSYEGDRHKKGLPVRGQRTNRNAHTRRGGKGRVVANKKK